MDTGSQYLALAEENSHHCVRLEKKIGWEKLRKKIAEILLEQNQPRIGCSVQKKHNKREPGLF